MMKVVSQNSTQDLDRRKALQDTEQALRRLAANLIRVTRGSGDAFRIFEQAADLVVAMRAYYDVAGHFPSDGDLTAALNTEEEIRPDLPDHVADRLLGVDLVIRGALQIAASRLLSQKLQVGAGESEMLAGMREIERARDRARKERDASIPGAAQRSKRGPKPAPRKGQPE